MDSIIKESNYYDDYYNYSLDYIQSYYLHDDDCYDYYYFDYDVACSY